MKVAGKAKEPQGPAFGKGEWLREVVITSSAECPFRSGTVLGALQEK